MPTGKDITAKNAGNQPLANEFARLIDFINYQMDEAPTKEKQKHRFRLRHIKAALKIIVNHPNKIKSSEDLKHYDGVGKGIKSRIDEFVETGKLSEIKMPKTTVDKQKVIKELTDVIGIGKALAKKMVEEYKIKSLDDLKQKHKEGRIAINEKIALGLKYHGKFKPKIPRKEIRLTEKYLKKIAKTIDKDLILNVAGSYRRGRSTSNDIDILITHKKVLTDSDMEKSKVNYLAELIRELKTEGFLVDDLTDDQTTKYMGFSKYKRNPIRRIDIRYVPHISYYPALLYFTGSYELNIKMRIKAKKMGYLLNEYGIYKLGKKKAKEFIKVNSEKEIFDILEMEYLEPNER